MASAVPSKEVEQSIGESAKTSKKKKKKKK